MASLWMPTEADQSRWSSVECPAWKHPGHAEYTELHPTEDLQTQKLMTFALSGFNFLTLLNKDKHNWLFWMIPQRAF